MTETTEKRADCVFWIVFFAVWAAIYGVAIWRADPDTQLGCGVGGLFYAFGAGWLAWKGVEWHSLRRNRT